MPRYAAKKTNKNAKRLPVLIKLTNINNKNKIKKKKVNSSSNKKAKSNSNSTSRNNINKSRNNNNNTTPIINSRKKKKQQQQLQQQQQQQQQQQKQNLNIEKAIVNANFTRLQKINDNNCDANVSISISTSTSTSTSIAKNSYATAFTKNPTTESLEQQQQQQQKLSSSIHYGAQQESILKDFSKNFKSIKLDDNHHPIKATNSNFETILNIKLDDELLDNVVKSKIIDNCSSSRSISSGDTCEAEIDSTTTTYSLQTTSLPSSSPSSSVSSLYPIVIETTEILQQQQLDKYNKEEQHQQQQQIKGEKDLNNKKKYKKLHSNNNNNNNTIVYCQTANDTLKQQQQQQQQQFESQHNLTSNDNKNSFSAITTSKRNNCNNNNNNNNNNTYKERKQSTQTKVSSTKATSIQSQEVKARLATLRTRKKVLQQQQEQQQQQQQQQPQQHHHQQEEKPLLHETAQRGLKTSLTTSSTSLVETSETCVKIDCSSSSHTAPKGYIKRAPLVLDDATLNLIETLNDNEVKKTNNKRKRNTSAALLTLASLHQPRPRRIAAILPPDKSTPTITTAAGITTPAPLPPSTDKNEQKQLVGGQFLKPLPIEATNTNTKKRARIMSLYERPFQAANEGRGSVVSNGYMTSSRSSASSGGVGGGAMVMSDANDAQEMANQYYLSGSSGSGIAGNSSSSLVGNGGVMNHAPTMGTLCNIGNTCYLNSVVYTLRFAPQFLHNLHHLLADLNALQQNIARARAKSSSLGRGISAVHMENARSWSSKDLASMEQYGSATVAGSTSAAVNVASHIPNTIALTQVTQKSSHQLLTEKLHELYQSLHRNEINESTEPHHADTLLHAIQDVSSIFEGNQQQDAHEFLMCLLNSIRETSQTLIKAIAECPDVILNGYISNPDEIERDLMKQHASGVSGGGVVSGGNSSSNSNSLASTTLSSLTSSKTSSFFSRKSKRKDDSKSSKNSRLQSPLKDALLSGGNAAATTTANSLFYLNTNDLNSATSSSSTSPASGVAMAGVSATSSGSVTSPSNSSPHLSGIGGGGGVGGGCGVSGGGDETDASTAVALILKDKQRLEGKIRELGLDFFNEDFEGITVSTTKCLSCETITEQKETMIDIAVPVPQDGYDSKEFMDSSFIQDSCITREYFRNENKYRCEQCCGYTEAIRSISYEVLPRLLIIQLSRFSGGMEKINSYIPTSFTLQCFCSKCCELSDANKLHIYKLYSVITHVGATMSVGHYIAYTCSLEWANEYINCPKEQRRRASQERNLSAAAGNGSSGGIGTSNQTQSASSSGLGSSSNSFMKMKMKFGRSKASSSGDMSKNVKQLNGLNSNSSKAITNGIGKLTMNNSGTTSGGGGSVASATPQCPVTCQSINCCAMRLTAQQQLQYQSASNSTSDFSEETSQYSNGSGYNTSGNYNNNIHHHVYTTNTSTNTSGYGSTGRGSTKASYATQNNCNKPIWYMCDDDKIKAMTQREFEELLSPARKITITPYLLFYARYNLQSTPPKSATASTSSPGPATSSPQTSWSNESLQSSGHSAHSSGIRM